MEVGRNQFLTGKNIVISKVTGVKSASVACPHCWTSITEAVEEGVPEDHVQIHDFYQGYKALQAEYGRSSTGQDKD